MMHRILKLLATTPAALALAGNVAGPPEHSPRYDYVVVGGGTSGLVVANRLSEDYNVTVAIIEAGDVELYNTNVSDTSKYGAALGTDIDWQYRSAPQQFANGATQILRAGKILGGTSDINGMTYLRAEISQIDAWEQIGNKGWNWEDLMRYYLKSEYMQPPTQDQILLGASYDPKVHGTSGPLSVGWTTNMMGQEVVSSVNQSFNALGLPFNHEPNSGSMRGFTVFPKSIDRTKNVREDAGRAYYWPVSKRPNLDIYLNSKAEKMIWHPKTKAGQPKASGVIFTTCNGTSTILANREAGVDVVVDLPFVGENLQDQTTTDMMYTMKNTTNLTGLAGYAAYANVEDLFGEKLDAFNETIVTSIREYAERTANISGVISADVTEKLFKMQYDLIFKNKIPIAEIIIAPASTADLTVEYWGLLPFSRGSIHINSSNATLPALINPNYFMLDYDVQQQVVTGKLARAFTNIAPFSDLVTGEVTPGLGKLSRNASDADWAQWLKSTCKYPFPFTQKSLDPSKWTDIWADRSNFHYVGTAAMMPKDLGGVVDPTLTVYGTSNVRVVDASVLPFQVCGHLASTLYAVAEKAADMIKAKYA